MMHRRILMAAVCLLISVEAGAQPAATNTQPTPSDASVIEMCGGGLKKGFAQIGAPQDVYPSGGEKNDSVTLDYGPFAFQVREKIIRICYFRSQWKGTIKGIKI